MLKIAATVPASPSPVLRVRRPLVAPSGDPRRLLRLMRRLFVRRTLLLLGVLVVLSLGNVWLQHQVVRVGYELAAARDLLERVDHEHRQLQAELASLRDPAKLEARARTELGMGPAQPWQTVELP